MSPPGASRGGEVAAFNHTVYEKHGSDRFTVHAIKGVPQSSSDVTRHFPSDGQIQQ
jgi:hypothetical protein